MKRWRIAFFTLLIITIISSVFLTYQIINISVIRSYENDSYNWKLKEIELLKEIINEKIGTNQEVKNLIKTQFDQELLFGTKDSLIWYGSTLLFKNDTLIKVINTQ